MIFCDFNNFLNFLYFRPDLETVKYFVEEAI